MRKVFTILQLRLVKSRKNNIIKNNNNFLHFSVYIFPWLHLLCICLINNDRKHAISAILISVFFGILIFDEWSALICVSIQKMIELLLSFNRSIKPATRFRIKTSKLSV